MKNNILITVLLFAFSLNMSSQVIKSNDDNYSAKSYKNDYYLNYLNNDDFLDLRTPVAKDKAFTFMYLFTFEDLGLDVEIDADSSSLVPRGENINRLTEKFVPNFRYYIDSKQVLTFGLIYAKNRYKRAEKYVDTLNTVAYVPNGLEETNHVERFSKLSLRFAYDRHFNFFRRKWFDLDPYVGASLNIGNSTRKVKTEEIQRSSDYVKLKTKENYFCLGGDLYFGVNMRFERFSLGAEVLAIGFDRQSGYGSRKVKRETSVSGVTNTDEYFEDIDNPVGAGGPAYSDLDFRRISTSMYRGVRLNFTFYIK
jgi:hypothetical protein